jgi:1,2-dihydroxy-3-keto-5-methylthiopentene dioxygenase
MSRLRIFADVEPNQPNFESSDFEPMRAQLATIGVDFERWPARVALEPGAAPEAVLAAYSPEIERLKAAEGYVTADVVSLGPDHPDRAALRQKFLNEHTHAEDEVRFFVAGSGLFTLHVNGRVYEMLCEAGDLIRVPAGTKHWFDMSEAPSFVALRLFNNPAGWVAEFTGDDIASRFPRFERSAA